MWLLRAQWPRSRYSKWFLLYESDALTHVSAKKNFKKALNLPACVRVHWCVRWWRRSRDQSCWRSKPLALWKPLKRSYLFYVYQHFYNSCHITFWLHVHELRSSSQEDHCSRQVSTLWAWNQWMFLTRCLDIFGYVAEPGTYQYHLAYSPMSPSSRQNKAVGDRSSSSSNIHGAAVRLPHSCIPKCKSSKKE